MNQNHKAKLKAREAKQERQARKVFSGIFLVLILLAILVILAYTVLKLNGNSWFEATTSLCLLPIVVLSRGISVARKDVRSE